MDDDKGATPHATEVSDFPSNDGFHSKIAVAVEWRINADKVAEVLTRLGNLKEIETKVTMPNTRSIARVEGSKYYAKDFIQGEARERFERVFFAALQRVCADKGVETLRGMVRKIQVPEEIANQELLRNQQEKRRADSAAEKMEAETRINQQPNNAWPWPRSTCRRPNRRPRPHSPWAKPKPRSSSSRRKPRRKVCRS